MPTCKNRKQIGKLAKPLDTFIHRLYVEPHDKHPTPPRTETDHNTVIAIDTYNRIGSIHQKLNEDEHTQYIILTDKAMDDLYEALKAREAHKQFLINKYGSA